MLLWIIIFNSGKVQGTEQSFFREKSPPSVAPHFLEVAWDGIEYCSKIYISS
jgi:hypothetical protein